MLKLCKKIHLYDIIGNKLYDYMITIYVIGNKLLYIIIFVYLVFHEYTIITHALFILHLKKNKIYNK